MRVAYVCADPGVPVFGHKGCSIHVQEMLRTMLRRGFEVDLFARRVEDTIPDGLDQLTITRLDMPRKSANAGTRERELVGLNRPLRIAIERGGPYDLVYERYALWSQAALQYAQETGTPSILEVNAPLVLEQSTHRVLAGHQLAEQISAEAFRLAGTRLAVSHAVADHVAALSQSNANLLVQPNGVDPFRFVAPRSRVLRRWTDRTNGRRGDRFVIGFVGTLRPWHGMPLLGQAFRMLQAEQSDVELLIVGDGPARDDLLASLGPDAEAATRITGKLPHQEVPALLGEMDVAVAPYPDHRSFYFSPLKLFEYMACGLPVVASHVGDLELYLNDRVTGRLVEPGNPVALTAAIRELRDRPRDAIRLGQQAAAHVQHQHTWDHVLDSALAYAGVGETAPQAARIA